MKKLISYVIPFYNDQGNVDALYTELLKVTNQATYQRKYDYEFVFINDGSRDSTLEDLKIVQKQDKRIRVVDLARNYGHQIAVTAGLEHSKGAAVIVMDSDLQDPPRVSLELIDMWEKGFEVAYAQRRSRKDSFIKKLTADIYYRLLQRVTEIEIPRNTGDFRLMDRQVVDELAKYREHNRFLRGMVSFVGFKQAAVMFDRDERFAGESGYSVKKLFKLASDGIFSFSSVPLKFISRLGFTIAGLSVVGTIYAVAYKILTPGATVQGWTFIVISIFMIGGVQLVMLGVLGSYIGRIYTEVQGRPLYLVYRIYEG